MALQGGTGGGSGSEVRAGGAFVEIFAKDKLSKVLDKTKARVEGFGKGLKSVGAGLGLIGGAMAAPFTALFASGVSKAGEIDKLAAAFGFSRKQIQQFAYAAEVAGVSLEDVINNQEKYQDLIRTSPLLDDRTVNDSVTAQREFNKAIIETRNAVTPLISSILPYIKWVGEFIKKNSTLVRTIFLVGTALAIAGAAIFAFGAVITSVVSVVGTLLSVGSAVIGVVFSKMGLVIAGAVIATTALVAGFVALNLWLLTLTEGGREFLGQTKKMFGELFDIATTTFGGIWAAISKGDWGQAWNVLKAGGIAAFKSIESWGTYVWVRLKIALVDSFRKAWNEVKNLTLDFTAWLMRNGPDFLKGGMTDEEINKARDDLKAENDAELKQKMDDAKKFRDDQIRQADRELAKAMAKLDQEVAKAKAEVGPGAGVEGFDHRDSVIKQALGAFRVLGDRRQFDQSATLTHRQLDLQKQQLRIAELQLEEQKKLNDAMRFK